MSIATDDGIPNAPNTAQLAIQVLLGIYALATFIPSFTVTIRRFHDFDKSGWWLLINLIPILGPLLQLIMMFRAGTPGKNRFGPQPG
ncbi:DUF805 domain-containing protein [Planctomicrobium piriforme]|uniref:DUF805 domain-containing protein n=1 Tax=Planctomicrobium piriforme TaxID=1576369 RepID=A0A1I3FYT6_9PLAN|nr:DUF805 domain-containing protein [Planctomicrobium piriforme]SFI16327.1 Protein of unknown function [Planctomicrobium piriforme]